jgi:hypothetical protein
LEPANDRRIQEASFERTSKKEENWSRGSVITLWHRTRVEAAARISSKGFRDGTGSYLTDREFSGVWLSDELLTANEGADGDTALCVVLDCTEDEIREFEWIEEGKGYREFLVPAPFIAARGTVTLAPHLD